MGSEGRAITPIVCTHGEAVLQVIGTGYKAYLEGIHEWSPKGRKRFSPGCAYLILHPTTPAVRTG